MRERESFRILLSFQKKDKDGRVHFFLVGSPIIFIRLFFQTLSAPFFSLYFVPGGLVRSYAK